MCLVIKNPHRLTGVLVDLMQQLSSVDCMVHLKRFQGTEKSDFICIGITYAKAEVVRLSILINNLYNVQSSHNSLQTQIKENVTTGNVEEHGGCART